MRATQKGLNLTYLNRLHEKVNAGDRAEVARLLRELAAMQDGPEGTIPREALTGMSDLITSQVTEGPEFGPIFRAAGFVGPQGDFVIVGDIVADGSASSGVLSMIAGEVLRDELDSSSGKRLIVRPTFCSGAIISIGGDLLVPARAWRFENAEGGPTLVAGSPSRPTLVTENALARLRAGDRGAIVPSGAAEAQRFGKDYHLPEGIEDLKAEWRKTSLWRSALTAAGDALSIPLIVASHQALAALASSPLMRVAVWGIGFPAVLLLVARQFRALEALVHEASHDNWTRRRSTNDRIANAMAAIPVIQRVESFRESHMLHHAHLGDEDDPCQRRFQELWAKLDRGSARAYALEMTRVMGTYVKSWWQLVGSDVPVLGLAMAWHVAVFIVPSAAAIAFIGSSALAAAFTKSLVLWVAYVVTSFVMVLPIIRFIAEAAKHDYARGTTTREGTFSNIGPIHWLLHPNGDAYHFLHHVAPRIVHHQAAKAHRWLMANDTEYAMSRIRHAILEEPPMPMLPDDDARDAAAANREPEAMATTASEHET